MALLLDGSKRGGGKQEWAAGITELASSGIFVCPQGSAVKARGFSVGGHEDVQSLPSHPLTSWPPHLPPG